MMTEKEMVEVEQLLQAGFQFLDFTSHDTHSLWYEALKRYDVIEVKAAIRDYVKNESKTPTVHDIVEYVRPIRDQRETERRKNNEIKLASEPVCETCHGRGFVTIIYPNGNEYVRPCNCPAGHAIFGPYVYSKSFEPDLATLFGARDQAEAELVKSQYTLVNVIGIVDGEDVIYIPDLNPSPRKPVKLQWRLNK